MLALAAYSPQVPPEPQFPVFGAAPPDSGYLFEDLDLATITDLELQGQRDWNTGYFWLPPSILKQTPLSPVDQAYFQGQYIARSGYFWEPAEFEAYWSRPWPVLPVPSLESSVLPDPDC